MSRYIDIILEWPKTIILILLLITLFFSFGISKLKFDNSIETFLPQNDLEYLFYNQTKDTYGDNGNFVIISERGVI